MPELAPLMRDQRKIDAEHLRLLSIFHFVGAGLAALGLLFLFAHYMLFHTFMANPKMWQNQSQNQGPPPAEFFAMFKWFYLVFAAVIMVSLILNVLSGIWIATRKNRTFSLVVGAFNGLYFPLGTILGVFTIIVLIRGSVCELYDACQQ